MLVRDVTVAAGAGRGSGFASTGVFPGTVLHYNDLITHMVCSQLGVYYTLVVAPLTLAM